MDSAIRWSPSSTPRGEQRFLNVDVGDKIFRLCRVTAFDGRRLEYEILSTHDKVPGFRAFDWSPFDESLVAVGQSSGEVTLLRLGESAADQASWSFPIRNQRYCNAVAFSSHGLLAGGLDKVRNDVCLNVWDVNHRIMASSSKGSLADDRHAIEPLRKLSSDPITSIKFFRDQPDTLVAGVKGQFIKLFDLRDNAPQAFLQFPTRCVHSTAIDWLDENYIASCSISGEPTVCIWDRRMGSRLTSASSNPDAAQTGPALEFRNVVSPKATIWSLRFSKTKRGCLGVLASNGHFKTYELAKEYLSEENRNTLERTLGQGSCNEYPEPIYTKTVRDIRSPYDHPIRGCLEADRVVAFDFLNMSPTKEPSVITRHGNGRIQIVTMQPPCAPVRLSSQNVLVRGKASGDGDFVVVHPHSTDRKIADVLRELRESHGRQKQQQGRPAKPLSSRESREHALEMGNCGKRIQDALTYLSVRQARCKEGYLFNCERNKQIVADDPGLQEFWDWVLRAREASTNQSIIVNRYDLSYIGVSDVWNSTMTDRKEPVDFAQMIKDLAAQLNLPETKGCKTEFPEHRRLGLRLCGAVETKAELEETVEKLVAQRQHTKAAALAVFQEEFRTAFMALRKNGPTQAHKLLAMAIVGSARAQDNENSPSGANSDWGDTCAEIATELTDPYSRAILAYVSKGNYKSVLEETTLPLRYRVEVALRWLSDEELTTYLHHTTQEAIAQGDIEGIILTGLRGQALDLFQSYIQKFDDVQTAVLAMSHTVPRFVDDNNDASTYNRARFYAWRETYRRQINAWKMQLERARFDVGSRRLAVTWDGQRLMPAAPQQVSLTCNYCARPLNAPDPLAAASSAVGGSTTAQATTASNNTASAINTTVPSVSSSSNTTAATSASASLAGEMLLNPSTSSGYAGDGKGILASGTFCRKCARHMPRCGVCSLWLGAPDPMSRAAIAADTAAAAAQQGDRSGGGGGGGGSSNSNIAAASAEEVLKRFFVFCIHCNHGFHANHARDWFTRHRVCPVAECSCICDR